MTSAKMKTNVDLDNLLTRLDHITDAPSINPDDKVRALVFRVIEQCNWLNDRVDDVNGGPAPEALKQKSLRQRTEAMRIHEEFATKNGTIVYYLNALIKRSLGLGEWVDSWETACNELATLDRDDLYFSLKGITQRLFRAINSNDIKAVQSCILPLKETLTLGEWGQMFHDKWWREQERQLGNNELWNKACMNI
jgi:hypothetical protein